MPVSPVSIKAWKRMGLLISSGICARIRNTVTEDACAGPSVRQEQNGLLCPGFPSYPLRQAAGSGTHPQ